MPRSDVLQTIIIIQLRAMDQKVAKKLFEEGAFLVLLDVPEKVEFGIDYNCWNVGPLFKGVKMIPPGLHFVFYRSATVNVNESRFVSTSVHVCR